MQTVLITGGTGMVGSSLTQLLLNKGYQVIVLTRKPKVSTVSKLSYAVWNIAEGYIDPLAIGKADAIVHLAGAGVADERWTKKRKQEIVDSRVKSGALLVKYLSENPHQVKTVVTASAIGWYGPDTAKSLQHGFIELPLFCKSHRGNSSGIYPTRYFEPSICRTHGRESHG